MTAKNRTPEQQERINGYMRRKDVKVYLVYEALHGTIRASPEHTKRFLETAPPEIDVLLDELLPERPAFLPARPRHEEPFVQCLVGMFAQKKVESMMRRGDQP